MFKSLRDMVFGLGMAFATVAAAMAGGAQVAGAALPPVLLESVTVSDGKAVVSGSVNAGAVLEVNGQGVDVGATGDFRAVVDLDAEAVVLTLAKAHGETVTVAIPTRVLLLTGGEGVLDALADAGISIDVPADGFTIVDGQWSSITGRVLDASNLAGLTVNGEAVLDDLGRFGGFSVQLPSSSNPPSQVTYRAVDRQGVSQTSTFPTTRVRSVISTRAGLSVSAAGARGVVIANIRFEKSRLTNAKPLRVNVTVKDRRGYLIRGAGVRLVVTPGRYVANGSARTGFTSRLGQAKFSFRLRGGAFSGATARYLALVTNASTPTACAKRKVVLRLPTLAGA
jgi:hypothetical protein